MTGWKDTDSMHSDRTSSANPVEGLLFDIGDAVCKATVFSSSAPARETTSMVGIESFDECVSEHLRRQHQLIVGERTLEYIRQQVGCAQPLHSEFTVEIKGRNILNGAPTVVTMTSMEFLAATERVRSQILDLVRDAIALCPPKLAEVIREHGILVAGEGATLRGLTRYLAEGTGIPARLGT